MGQINLNSILARYQHSFGYVAANVAEVVGNRIWANMVKLPMYQEQQLPTTQDESVQLFTANDSRFAEVILESSKSGKIYRFGASTNYGLNSVYLAPPLMMSFSRGKNVVKTAIDRSEIEVIEYFGLKPYTIKLQGILIDMDSHSYPRELVQEVNQLFEESGTYKVSGSIFSDLGIVEIFLEENFEVSFVEGYADTVKFSVDACATAPLELIANGF